MDIIAQWHPQTDNPTTQIVLGKTTGRFVFINESFQNLRILLSNGHNFYLPARTGRLVCIDTPSATFTWNIIATMNIPSVDLAIVEYYQPGETIHEQFPVSLVSGGGTVTGGSTATLSNEGNPSNVLVEDIGDTAFSQLFTLYTDGHALWYVDQAGIRHQVIKIQASGNPLQLGQSGDISEVLGNLTVDQLLKASGGIAGPGATDLNIDSAGVGNIRLKVNGNLILSVVSGGLQLQSGSLSLPDGGGISGMFAIGPTSVAQAGTSITHNMGKVPTFVVPVHDTGGQNGDIITINFGTMTSTTFTAYSTNPSGSGNVRFLVYH